MIQGKSTNKAKDSYRQILKATSLFGGVQVFTILISILKSKFVAVLLGPEGMGIIGILNSTTGVISGFTNLGLERSAVKNISSSSLEDKLKTPAVIVGVLRKLVWATGLLGAFITFTMSGFISEIVFDNLEYAWAFKWLSLSLLFNQLSAGESAVLRGLKKLRFIALSTLYGSLMGLLISYPLYYYYRINGIVPVLLFSSIFMFLINYYYGHKVKIYHPHISKSIFLSEGKSMAKMGMVLSISSLIVLLESFVVRLYISKEGSIEDVGFYTAGFAVISTYFSLFFTALSTEYYPKLSSIINKGKKYIVLMNEQSEMTILILAPFLTIFLILVKPLVVILYSSEYLLLTDMVLWGCLGIYLKAASWSLGVLFISKGDIKTLFWSELSATSVLLFSNIIGYKYFGLKGLGISFLLGNSFTYLQTFLLVKFKYGFTYVNNFYKIFIVQIILGILSLFTILYISNTLQMYVTGSILLITSSYYSFYEINKRVEIVT